VIKDILSKLPIGGGSNKMSQAEQIQAQSQAYNFDPNNVAPPEVRQQLFALLKWRDNLYRDVVKTIEMIPGLEDLVDQLSNALNACK
jgi:Heterokaryon incompatibility protein Het-C